ncbi:MAG: type II secretion system protein GspG [Candidatus Omnitrophica bacterium]|nr:type II secretion system protein GspG [Candidatus Omnitrophota bacterium]
MFSLKVKRSFSVFELMVVSCVIFILIGLFANYFNIVLRAGREEALKNELMNLRLAIQHYQINNNSFPVSLQELTNIKLTPKDFSYKIMYKYLNYYRVMKDGTLVDPFLNRYAYDKNKGQVNSTTKGYERW